MHSFVFIELILHNAETRQRVTCPHLASSNQSKPQPPKLNNSCLTHRIQLSVHSSLCHDLLHAPCIHVSNTSGSTINQFLHAIKVWIFSVKCHPFSFVTRSLKTRTKMHKERPKKIASWSQKQYCIHFCKCCHCKSMAPIRVCIPVFACLFESET